MKKNINLLIFSILIIFTGNLSGQQHVDLTAAAENSVHAVVHIKTEFSYQTSVWQDFFGGTFWQDFFGNNAPGGYTEHKAMGAGSGVIISPDGYIVTNNHVVEDAQKITVTLNDRREIDATIVGTDPKTDLALIKINMDHLPTLEFANSDEVRIGEWVLAVGNPFNLTSTVTAGIVSAKARNLDILGEYSSVESFIQTDAAVNQGNSGGALVNTSGKLIGINSAILSGTGYYTGYSFAIPANIVKKVVDDLIKYNSVQRAYVGIAVLTVDQAIADEMHLEEIKGVIIKQISADGAAERAGLQINDIICSINGHPVNSYSELKEIIAVASPGDKVPFVILRNNKKMTITLELLNDLGNTEILYNND